MFTRSHYKIFTKFLNFRTHTKETPYQCPICSSAYSYRSTLKSHMAKVHNQVPTPNASLLRQPPDEKDSTLKQIPNISEGSLCNQEASSLKESPRDNFNDLRMHPNYSLQQTSSRQDESVDGSNENMNSSYQTVQIGSRISHDEQNIGIY